MTRHTGGAPVVTVVLPCLDEASSIGDCIEEAKQAMLLKDKDPVAFTERMANMMEWMLGK